MDETYGGAYFSPINMRYPKYMEHDAFIKFQVHEKRLPIISRAEADISLRKSKPGMKHKFLTLKNVKFDNIDFYQATDKSLWLDIQCQVYDLTDEDYEYLTMLEQKPKGKITKWSSIYKYITGYARIIIYEADFEI